MSAAGVVQCWNQFWFKQTSPAPVCAFRIFFGALVLISNLLWTPDLLNYFGPKGLVSVETIQQFEKHSRFSILFFAPQSESIVVALYAVLLISSFMVMIGCFTRPFLVLLYLSLISFQHRNAAILHSGDTLLRLLTFLLIFSPAAAMFSVDQRRVPLVEQWKVQAPCWSQRLLQLQIAAVYCQTFFAKMAGETWWNGTAVYYASRIEEFQKFSSPYMFEQLWIYQLLTYTTLLIEFALWTLVWFKKTRYIVLIIGIIMHVAIDWTMNIPLFEYTMIIGYINFVEAADVQKLARAIKMAICSFKKNVVTLH